MTRSTRQPLTGALVLAGLALAGCGSAAAGAGGGASPAGNTAPAGGGTGSAPAPGAAGSASPGQPDGTGGRLAAGRLLCSGPGSVTQVVITKITQGGPVVAVAPAGATPAAGAPAGATPAAGAPAGAVRLASAMAGAVVKGAAQAQQLARQLCALPAMPARTVHCPLATTAGYKIIFIAPGRVLPPITVQATGCESVTGAGSVRTSAGHPGFLKLLAGMAGPVPLPGAGHLPGGPVSAGPFRPVGA